MTGFLRSRITAFRHAFAGLKYVVRTQKNAWIHFVATLLVIIFSFWLNLTLFEWTVIILAIGCVWTAEIINTSIEAVVDLASPQKHPLAKIGKDVAAAGVLVSAITSAVIGFLLLGPPLYQKLIMCFAR